MRRAMAGMLNGARLGGYAFTVAMALVFWLGVLYGLTMWTGEGWR